MNLALEYLIRTKSIRNFFRTPCSLFLERGEDKVVVTFEGMIDDCYLAKRWHLSNHSSNKLPCCLQLIVPKKEIFQSNLVIPDGFLVFNYYEESVDTSLNSYKRPMTEGLYTSFIQKMLFSENHWHAKEQWLWEAFYESLPTSIRKRYFDRWQMLCDFDESEEHPWQNWMFWKKTFLQDKDNPAACELIFLA